MAKTSKKKTAKKTTKKAVKKPRAKSSGMKSYASFDLWIEDQTPLVQELIKSLRRFVKTNAKELDEAVKWGNGCWVDQGGLPIVFISAEKEQVQFGFFAGSMLKDPKQLLSGNGRYVRSVKIRERRQIKPADFLPLLRQAIKIKYR